MAATRTLSMEEHVQARRAIEEVYWKHRIWPKKNPAPKPLRDLFAARGNDPRLIAETLARRTLADRVIPDWYPSDDRFHGEVRRQADHGCRGHGSAGLRAKEKCP